MAISDKTRKILWGRSGNRCAMCRRELVIDATATDAESVVGEECHIVSGSEKGPRYNPNFPSDKIDQIENLILLCRVHHKMVDDQVETHTSELLIQLKSNHEQWVSSSLEKNEQVKPVRIRRISKNIPTQLARILSGKELINLVGACHSYAFDNDELESEVEVSLVSEFFQNLHDWGDLWQELESGDRVKAAHWIGTQLSELEEAGFWIFGAKEIQSLEGGIGDPSEFRVAHLRVLRSSNKDILTVDDFEPEGMNNENSGASK